MPLPRFKARFPAPNLNSTASDVGGDDDGFPFHPSVATATTGPERVSSRVPGTSGGREQAVSSQEQWPYDGKARWDRPVVLPHTPPQVSGVEAPQWSLEGDALSAALRDSLNAIMIPIYDRLSFLETAVGASQRSRRRRCRLSFSFSDGEDSGGDGGRHVPRRAVARSLGRELEGYPHRRLPEKIIPADDR